MELRKFDYGRDFDILKIWIDDERTHAMWCANLFEYPLNRENVAQVLEHAAEKYGDVFVWQRKKKSLRLQTKMR